MNPTIALLPSALLGPAVWQPVRERLRAAGREVIVAGEPGASGTSVADILRWYLDSLPTGRDYVLVPQSNAGLYVPAITTQRFPLSYFAQRVTVAPGWSDRPAGYLAFGDAYRAERVTAESWGWRSARLDGGHLHMLNAPGEVAAALARLL